MKPLKIGYWPLISSLDSPGDRRRIVFWAKSRGHIITQDLSENVDVIVASENADFNSPIFSETKKPIILDLVDAYLSPLNKIDDLARGVAKKFAGQLGGPVKPFSLHVKDFCVKSKIVVCSSIEQSLVVSQFNKNIHIILDSHNEIPFLDYAQRESLNEHASSILWEGQPGTIRGVKQISELLQIIANKNDVQFDFLTDQTYFKLLNKYFKRSTLELIKKDLGAISEKSRIISWSPENLFVAAQRARVAMIPIDLSIPMQRLKPENRLLIMWRMGLPCLTSPSEAYRRVANKAGVNVACENSNEWLSEFQKILEDPHRGREQVLRGQNYLRENHNELILLKKWDDAIESAMS